MELIAGQMVAWELHVLDAHTRLRKGRLRDSQILTSGGGGSSMQIIYIFSSLVPQISTLEDCNHNAPVYGKFHRHDRSRLGMSSLFDRLAANFCSMTHNPLSSNEQMEPTTAAFGTTFRKSGAKAPQGQPWKVCRSHRHISDT